MKVRKFEDLEIWQEARKLVKEIYSVSLKPIFARDFGLSSQIQRAAVSSMSNIAEGFERYSRKEFAHYLNITNGSLAEVKSQLYVALDLGYLAHDEFDRLYNRSILCGKKCSSMIAYLKKTQQ